MRFGLFIPQGWRQDLTGIEPRDHWQTMSGLATHADEGDAFESIWVYDHFHAVPEPNGEATHEAWSLINAFAATHQPGPPRPDVHVHGVPQPRLPGEGGHDRGHHLRRPRRDGHRRRLVRARVAARTATASRPPATADRDARRGRADLQADVDQRHRDAGREALPGGRRPAVAAPPAGRRPAAVDRGRRREEDAAHRRRARRVHQLRGRPRGVRAQVGDPARPLRGHRPPVRGDHAVGQLQRGHRRHRGRGRRPHRLGRGAPEQHGPREGGRGRRGLPQRPPRRHARADRREAPGRSRSSA